MVQLRLRVLVSVAARREEASVSYSYLAARKAAAKVVFGHRVGRM